MRRAVKIALNKLCKVDIELEDVDFYLRENRNFYDGGRYHFYKKEKQSKTDNDDDYGYIARSDDWFFLNSSGANYCCGIPELGGYERCKNKNTIFTTENLVLCFNFIKAQENTGYFQMYTTSRACDRWINNVLPKAGFKKKVTLPSKHGNGRYKVIAWDWLK